MAEQDQDELPWESSIDEDDEDLDAAVEDLPPEAVEDFRDVLRRHGLDDETDADDAVVVELPDGRLKWRSQLSDEELAVGYRVRHDLAAPPGRLDPL
jgi:hypothetical protein